MSSASAPSKLTVAILPLGNISPWQITLTAEVLKHEFGVKTMILPPVEIPPECFDAKRNVYLASEILTFLFFQLPHNAQRIVGIINGAVEHDGKKPCIGLADLHKRTALCGVPRVLEQSRDLLTSKIRQDLISYLVITHEFIHTLGVEHCSNPDCVMNAANHSAAICSSCRRWINRELMVCPGSAEERFTYADAMFFYHCFPQAITAYREVIAIEPKEPLYHHCLGFALQLNRQFDEAKQEMTIAIELSNDTDACYYNLGLIYLRANDTLHLADNSFHFALAVAKNPMAMQRLIGQAYRYIAHDVERAGWHYKEYLRLGGDDQNVMDWLFSRSQL